MRVLTANVGSSSVKLRLLDRQDNDLWEAELAAAEGDIDEQAAVSALADAPAFDAVAHRFVHGGARLRETTLVSDQVVAELREAQALAPLHTAAALSLLDGLRSAFPAIPQVACLDTAFHRHLPQAAAVYPVPWEWTERLGMRRYGFHGLSHDYASRRGAELLGRPREELRLVSCHLGAGASLAAVKGGVSVDTTMGLTPNEGLMMASRSG